MLQSIWDTIQEAIKSVNTTDTTGLTAFKTFFNDTNSLEVINLLERVAIGESIPFHGTMHPPTIMCDNTDVPVMSRSNIHAQCIAKPNIKAFWARNTNTVFLCSNFWRSRAEPSPNDCIGHLPDGYYVTGLGLVTTRWTILFHELVHLYLGKDYLDPEVRSIYDVTELSSWESFINPPSYAFFLASMYLERCRCWGVKLMLISVDFKAGCTTYKPLEPQHWDDRGLLEIGNSTAANDTLSMTDVVNVNATAIAILAQ